METVYSALSLLKINNTVVDNLFLEDWSFILYLHNEIKRLTKGKVGQLGFSTIHISIVLSKELDENFE